ncbi:MAG: hypothetical protein ACI9WV_001590, partial [Patiriisocius sp.]
MKKLLLLITFSIFVVSCNTKSKQKITQGLSSEEK